MILDARTIALLFLDGLSAVLVVALLWIALRARFGRREAAQREALDSLLLLCMGALLLLRVVAWAVIFLVLDGYVPSFASKGVMCAYGVVQLRPELAQFALWATPLSVAGLLFWWSMAGAERGVLGAPFQGPRFALCAPVALLVALEIVARGAWIFAEKSVPAVTCCSAALDPTRRELGFGSAEFLGFSRGGLMALQFGSKALLAAACLSLARTKRALAGFRPWGLCALTLASGWVDLIAWGEVIAPRALGLEFHRCALELLTDSIALGPTALLAALAHLGLLSLPGVALWRAREPEGCARAARKIAAAAALIFVTELAVLAVHVY